MEGRRRRGRFMRRLAPIVAMSLAASTLLLTRVPEAWAERCGGDASGKASGGGFQRSAHVRCDGTTPSDPGSGSASSAWPKWRTLDCGPPRLRSGTLSGHGNDCSAAIVSCAVDDPRFLPRDPHVTTTVTIEKRSANDHWTFITYECAVMAALPRLTAWMVRQDIIRRVQP